MKRQYEKRTPAKYQPEFVAVGMICLNSKVYHCWCKTSAKTSFKGTPQKRNQRIKEDLLRYCTLDQSHSMQEIVVYTVSLIYHHHLSELIVLASVTILS